MKREQLLSILNDLQDGYYEVDLNGNFTFFNDAMCLFTGYSREEMQNMNNRQYMSRDSARKVLRYFNRVYRTGEPERGFEFEIIIKTGETRYVEGSISLVKDGRGKPSGFRGIVRDISRRKNAEEALRQSEREYRLLVENATEGILIVQDGVVEYANPHILKLFGYTEQEYANRPFEAFVSPVDRDRLIDAFERIVQGESIEDLFSFTVDSKKGSKLLFQAKGVRVTWKDKPAVLTFLRDITSHAMLETRLQNAQKMEAIGTLAGGIAHDFNNILGSILLNAEIALEDTDARSESGYSLEQIVSASHRAKDLVEQILTFSRNSEVDKRPLNIRPVVKETTKMMRAMFPSTVQIDQYVSDDIDYILANPTQIQQLLLNLSTNAVHAMKEKGGTLEVSLESVFINAAEAERLNVSSGNFNRLKVSDTGHGIASNLQEKIFDPFFTTKSTGEGTGLGLSVVHGIVQNHNGTMNMNSAPGKGTEFLIYFPVIEQQGRAEQSEGLTLSHSGNKQILFVDDDEALRGVGGRMLELMGYGVFIASNGTEALEMANRMPENIDLVITDMTMPGMTGVELSMKLLDMRADIPIILCTGYHETVNPDNIKEMGIRGYLSKPYSQSDLARMIAHVLGDASIDR